MLACHDVRGKRAGRRGHEIEGGTDESSRTGAASGGTPVLARAVGTVGGGTPAGAGADSLVLSGTADG
eukprot:3724239-Pleurochrysis_carterae.AAC.4